MFPLYIIMHHHLIFWLNVRVLGVCKCPGASEIVCLSKFSIRKRALWHIYHLFLLFSCRDFYRNNLSWRILKKIDTKVQILIYKSHTNFAIILQNNHEYQKCKNNYNQTVKQFTTFKKRLKSLKNLLKPLKNNFVSSWITSTIYNILGTMWEVDYGHDARHAINVLVLSHCTRTALMTDSL